MSILVWISVPVKVFFQKALWQLDATAAYRGRLIELQAGTQFTSHGITLVVWVDFVIENNQVWGWPPYPQPSP